MEKSFPDTLYKPNFLGPEKAMTLMEDCLRQLKWEKRKIRVFGKWVEQPRKIAWFSDPRISYSYSGITLGPNPLPSFLEEIRQQVVQTTKVTLNSLLINYYENGEDYMGWHCDNEPELGENPTIAALSLGEERSFQFKHKKTLERKDFFLEHNSLLVMQGKTQAEWNHQLPIRKKIKGPRLSLTFRRIINC